MKKIQQQGICCLQTSIEEAEENHINSNVENTLFILSILLYTLVLEQGMV